MQSRTRRPSPALAVAVIALIAALSGSALALPGKNTIDKNDIKKGAVTKKAIKKGAVTTKAIKPGAVSTDAIADAAVTSGKLAPLENSHVVGAAGEPQFSNGGEGDCVWQNFSSGGAISGLEPVSFYKDGFGIVHLVGIAAATDGPGGDGDCNPGAVGEVEDGIAFTLPAGYRPLGLKLSLNIGTTFVAPDAGAAFGPIPIPAGAVFGQGIAVIDGLTYRTTGPSTAAARAKVDPEALQRLTR